jgi:hypothetical protein
VISACRGAVSSATHSAAVDARAFLPKSRGRDTPAEIGRSYRKGAARRTEILSKAIGLFAEHGAGASLRAIADAR